MPTNEGGPFQTTEAVEAIAGFLKEMFPVIRSLQGLAVDVYGLRIGFSNSFHSAKLNDFDRQYVDLQSPHKKTFNAPMPTYQRSPASAATARAKRLTARTA